MIYLCIIIYFNSDMRYNEVDWSNIDYSKITQLKKLCMVVKNHFWDTRKCEQHSDLIVGAPCRFLVKVFEMYHPQWFERVGTNEVVAFVVKIDKEYKTQNFNVVLKDYQLDDTSFSYSKLSKCSREEADVKAACREAVHRIIFKLKKRYCFSRCPISGLEINLDNAEVHHYAKSMRLLIKEWVDLKGGFSEVVKYVNQTIGGGTITCFNDEVIIQDFIKFHNQNTHLVVLHREGHSMIHKSQKCLTDKQKDILKKFM